MNGDTQFNPQTWQQAAERLASQAQALAEAWQRASATIGNPSGCGCNDGGTLADSALALTLPAMLEAVAQTVTGISNGLANEALATGATGMDYLDTEAENEALAKSLEI